MPIPDWKSLRHAYGSAEDLPEILAELEAYPTSFDWSELFDRVLHQYSTFSASVHVLPYIARAIPKLEPSARGMPLALAGGIVSGSSKAAVKDFESCLDDLGILALDNLDTAPLTRGERVYVMQAAMAFAGDRLWGHMLDRLNDGEFRAKCQACNHEVRFLIGDQGHYCVAGERPRKPATPSTPIQPCPPAKLPADGRKLRALCMDQDPTLAEWVCYLFGKSTCPQCAQPLSVREAIARDADLS
jgi:hypothetical protein